MRSIDLPTCKPSQKAKLRMNDHTAVRLHSQTPAGGFVYVLREPFGRVKIGMTQHIKRRFDQLNTASAYDLEIVIVLESENAPQVERYLHRHFAAKRARLEWFDLDTEDIAYIRQGSYLGAALKTPRLQPKPHLRARRVELDFASLTPEQIKRRAAIRQGMKQAADRGQHVGRPADDPAQIIASYPAVVDAIRGGLSLRAAAAAAGVAVNTVRKVKAALDTFDTPST